LLAAALVWPHAGAAGQDAPVASPEDAAGEEATAAGLRAVEAELVASLEALVLWCKEERLFARREALCLEILALDPESVTAHEGLLHERDDDGNWMPPKKKSPAKDYTKSALEEYERRRVELGTVFAASVLELTAPRSPGAAPTLAERAALFRALELTPDHPELRARLGEQREGDAWVLDETARAKQRRPELKQIVDAALAGAPAPEPTEPHGREAATGVTWTVAVATPWVRVLGTGDADEAQQLARTAHAAIAAFQGTFGTDTRPDGGYTIYLLANDTDRIQFVSAWPTWGPAHVEATAAMVGAGVPRSQHTARWDPDPVNRLDGAMRHTLGELLRSEFRLSTDHAWAWEGFGIYLTRSLVGTRRTWYGSAEGLDAEEQKLVARLMTVDVNWMNEAYQLMKTKEAPELTELFARPMGGLGVEDLLMANAVAAYLIEGESERVGPLLHELTAEGSSGPAAFEKVLGRPLAETQARLERWMGERR
jgi:hypothetical protein